MVGYQILLNYNKNLEKYGPILFSKGADHVHTRENRSESFAFSEDPVLRGVLGSRGLHRLFRNKFMNLRYTRITKSENEVDHELFGLKSRDSLYYSFLEVSNTWHRFMVASITNFPFFGIRKKQSFWGHVVSVMRSSANIENSVFEFSISSSMMRERA